MSSNGKKNPRYWLFVRGIHRSPVNSPHKSQWRGALMFLCAWINGWVNNREAEDLRRHRANYDVIEMKVKSAISVEVYNMGLTSGIANMADDKAGTMGFHMVVKAQSITALYYNNLAGTSSWGCLASSLCLLTQDLIQLTKLYRYISQLPFKVTIL